MTDLATLGLVIDSTQVKSGVGELDKLTAAGTRAEKAVDKLGTEAAQAGAQVKGASAAAAEYAANAQRMANNAVLTGSGVSRMGTATTLAARSVNTLSTEVGVLSAGLATGSIGAQGLATSLGRISIAALVLMPALGAVAAAVAVAALAFSGLKDEAASDAEMKKFIGTLGLTEKEIKKLKDTTVTWGDVASATFQVLAEKAGTSASEITGWFDYAFRKIGEFGKFSVAIIYAAFVAGAKGIINTWNAVPAIIGEAAVSAANAALAAMEAMVNIGVQKINSLIAGVNMLPFVDLPTIAAASFGKIENKWAGTAKKLGETLDADFHGAFDSAMSTMDEISARATTIRKDADRDQANEIIGDRSDKGGGKKDREKKAALSELEKAYRAAMKAAQDYLDAIGHETDMIGKTAVEQKRYEVAIAAANARQAAAVVPTKEGTAALLAQAAAIEKAGANWEMVYKNDQVTQFLKNTVEQLEFETSILGMNAEQQSILRAEREATAAGVERGSEAWVRYMDAVNAANAAEAAMKGPEQMLETLRQISDQASVTAGIMADSFGKVGDVFGGLLESLTSYQEARQALTMDVAKGNKTQAQADQALATLQARNTAQAISGFKSLFKEKSAGYKIMQAIEMAYAAWQVVNTIRSIALDGAKTASSVANSGARAAADGVAAVAKAIASLPFPLNLAAGAATAAALIAFGVKMFGGGGGGGNSGTPPTSAEDLQEQAGTGTILGDSKAKSDSIARSLEIVAANTNSDLEYSNAMLKALRNIDMGIAKMAGTVARQISVSGSLFDTSGQNLGTNSKKGFLGVFGGSTTTRNLYDLGVQFGAASVGSIIDQGISGNSYQVIEQIKKKKGFFGIGGGTKTTYKTTTGEIDPEITAAIQSVIMSLRDGLVSAADVIGLDGAQAILDSFQVNLGKISFKDMTGEQIEDQLNAVFSSIGDQMAGRLLPSLASLQLVGEGLFETFMRVAREYQVVDIAMKSLGRTFGATGMESVAMRDHLVQLFGGVDEFLESTNTFRDEFLSEAEQMAPIAASVRAEMERLGKAGITTRDQFKQAVLGLDLTTTAGREMYASLLAVAPAFDKVLDYVEKLNKAQIDSLQNTVDQFTKFAESLKKYRDTLFQTDATQGNAYNRLRSQFMSTADLAATGDATALGGLENAGRSFLEAARNNASSREQYLRDVALVARGVDRGIFAAEETADYAQLQLDALVNAVGILTQIQTNTAGLAVPATVSTPAGAQPAPSSAPATPAPTQEQTQTLIQQNAQIISLLRDQKQLWQRFEGDGLLVKSDADTPVYTTAAP